VKLKKGNEMVYFAVVSDRNRKKPVQKKVLAKDQHFLNGSSFI
jgi:hypothetical protein